MNERAVSVWQCVVPLAVLTTIFTIGLSFVAVHSRGTPRTAELLWAFEFRLMLAWWVSIDRRIRSIEVPFEFDAFVFFIWPFLVPYYLYRTRGGKGLLIVTSIYVMYLTPYVAAQIARIVRQGDYTGVRKNALQTWRFLLPHVIIFLPVRAWTRGQEPVLLGIIHMAIVIVLGVLAFFVAILVIYIGGNWHWHPILRNHRVTLASVSKVHLLLVEATQSFSFFNRR